MIGPDVRGADAAPQGERSFHARVLRAQHVVFRISDIDRVLRVRVHPPQVFLHRISGRLVSFGIVRADDHVKALRKSAGSVRGKFRLRPGGRNAEMKTSFFAYMSILRRVTK